MRRRLTLRPPARRPEATIPCRPASAPAPLSFGQEQLWLHNELAPDAPLYVESLTIHRRGALDPEALAASFDEIIRRHEIWRTAFVWADGQIVQQADTVPPPRLSLTDLRHLPAGDREAAALRLAAADLATPFDLAHEPGVRGRLVTLSATDHRLFLCLHHLVFDGISIYGVFLPELVALYEARVTGGPRPLEEPPLQYADFAYWQRRTFDPAAAEPLVRYWRARLAGAPSMIDLPADHPRPPRQSFRGALVRAHFAPELTAAVRRRALEESATVFMLLLASFGATLHAWTGQTDMLIGSVSGGRDRPELERLIGHFLRMLVLRADLGGNPTFRELLDRVREVLVDALIHDALPFQHLIRALAPTRDLSRSPLFQVTFSIEPPLPALGPHWDLTEMDAGAVASKFDLSVELEDRRDIIAVRAIYSPDLFESSTIARLLTDWRALLGRAVSDPALRLDELAVRR